MRTLLLTSLLCGLASGVGAEETGFSVTPQVETSFGDGGYSSVDSEVQVRVPYGFSFTGGHNTYDSESLERAHSYRFGLEKEFSQFGVSGAYARSPLCNNYGSRTWGFGVSAHDSSEDFRTEVGFDGEVTHHIIHGATATRDYEVSASQRALRARLTQSFWDTSVAVELGNNSYNKDIPLVLRILSRQRFANTIPFGDTVGVLSGFPDTTQSYSVMQGFGKWPMSAWASYANAQLVTADAFDQRTSDAITFGVDLEPGLGFTVGGSFSHIRQTSESITRLYSFSLSRSFGD